MRGAVLKGDRVRLSDEARIAGVSNDGTGLGEGGASPCADHEPAVSYRRNGDVVEAIEITCPCGRRIVLECQYDAFDSGS